MRTPHNLSWKGILGKMQTGSVATHFWAAAEPIIVKKHWESLVNSHFCKKKRDANRDTHGITVSVQLWKEWSILIPFAHFLDELLHGIGKIKKYNESGGQTQNISLSSGFFLLYNITVLV